MSTASKVGMQQNLWNCVHPLGRQCHSTSSDQPRVVVASQGAPWWASSSYMSWHSGLWSHSSGGQARVVICAMSTMCGKGVAVLITTLLPQLLVEAEPEAEPDAEPMMSSFNSPSNSLYTYRTLPPPTMMQMASESPSSFSNSDNTRYTTARPLFIPDKATTLQSPIYYPESPALPQYYPGPLTSGSERWRWSKMEDFNLLLSNLTNIGTKILSNQMQHCVGGWVWGWDTVDLWNITCQQQVQQKQVQQWQVQQQQELCQEQHWLQPNYRRSL